MDKYDYVITKPQMEEVLYHAGFHKYIDKYLGKNGKWIYKYANQAKSAATGAVNKAKTMLPGLQKQATGAVSTVKKQTSSALATGSKTASNVKKQAKSRINSMLPILSKKLGLAKSKAKSTASKASSQAESAYSSAKKQASSTASKAKSQASKLKKQADGTYSNVKKAVKSAKTSNAYQRTKRKVGETVGKYKKATSKGSATKGDSRYRNTGNLSSRGYQSSKSSQVGLGGEQYYNDGRYFYNAQGKYVSTNTTNRLKRKQSGRNNREYIKRTSRKRR